jgi:hypothetical protein
MKKISLLLTGLAITACVGVSKAQIAGTFSVPATYTSIAAAISDINTQGVSGPVTILVDAGYTETAPMGGFTFTATGTSANTITFQKNGPGANPLITAFTGTATPASALQDGVWKFIGSDYVTIDGIDINDPNTSNPATMEYGYGFFKASATNGCQNNMIRNCTISLSIVNNVLGSGPAVDGSRGIDMVNALYTLHTTNVVVTSAAGTNSNNKFYSNTIQNCNIGIALIGYAAASPFTNADTGNDIGGGVSSNGNTIINFGGGGVLPANPAAGIRTLAQYNIIVSNNMLNSNNGSGTLHPGIIRGIYLNTATSANATISNNTVTIKGGGTSQSNNAIENASGSTASNNTITIANNLITGCTYTTATTASSFYGIYNNGASPAVLAITDNTITGNSTNGTTGSYYNIYNNGSVAQTINMSNNKISAVTFSATSTSMITYNIYNSSAGANATLTIAGNDIQNHTYSGSTGGTGAWYGVYALSTSTVCNIQNNTLTNLSLKTTGTVYFIYNSHTSATTNVSNNSVVGTFARTVAGSGALYGIYNGWFGSSGNVANINDNNFSNISNGSSTGAMYMVYWTTHLNLNIFNNTFSAITATAGTSTFYGLYPYYYSYVTNVYNNTVSNVTYGSTSGTIYGLYFYEYNGTSGNVYQNTFYNLKNGGSTNVGMYIYYTGNAAASGPFNFYQNKISDIGSSNANAAGVAGINLFSLNGGIANIYNNLVGNITATASSNGNAVTGINISSSSSALTANLYYNTVHIDGTSSALGFGSAAVWANTAPTTTFKNNIFVNNTSPTGTGLASAYRRTGASFATYSSASNNNLFYAGLPSASSAVYFDGTTPYSTLSSYQAFSSPADGASVTENPPFLSIVGTNPNFLNINPATPTQVEGWATPITTITTDYVGTTRNASAPDIGAWEGNYISSIPVCSGTPGANTVVASSATICPNTNANLALSTSYTNTGMSYQWMASATGAVGSYTNIPGANASVYTSGALTSNTYFQAVITCTASAASTTATSIMITVSGNPCGCLAYCASAATSSADDEIFNVTIGSLNNTSNCTQTGGPGSTLNMYSNYTGMVAAPTLVGGATYNMSLTVGQCGATAYSGGAVVYMDFNQNGSFLDAGEQVYVSPSTLFAVAGTMLTANVTIPTTALAGITRMRVIAVESNVGYASCGTFSWGETEDYCIDIQAPVPCSGAPASNTAVPTVTSVCPNGSVTLNLASTYTTVGLTYQWSTSTSSLGPWTPVSSATLASFTATNLTASTWFQAVITCTNGPASTTASAVEVQVNGNPCSCLAYCTSSATSTGDDEIFNVSIGTLNNTSSCSQTGGPGSTLNQYSNYTGIVGAPTLIGGNNYTFSVTVGQCGAGAYSGGVTIYMDFNANGSFADAGEQVFVSPSTLFQIAGTVLTGNISVPPTAVPGITRMRVIAVEGGIGQAPCTNFTWGETEDYCIDIQAPTPCAGAPASNTVIAVSPVVCPGGSTTLNLANSYTLGGLTYQWATSTSSLGPWTPVTTATLSSFTATNITVTTWYQAVITCTNGPASTTAVAASVNPGGNPCLCAAYCASSATSVADDEIFNVSIGTLNNTSNCTQTGGPGSVLNQYSNYAGMIAAPNLTVNQTYTLSLTVGQCGGGAYSGIVTTYIDYNQNGSFTDSGELVYTSTYTTFAIAGTTFTTNITIPVSAVGGVTRMRVVAVESTIPGASCGAFTWGEVEDYCVNIDPGPPCTSANAGTITAPSYSACNNQTVSLTSTSVTIGAGTTYSWMVSSTPGGPYSPVSGGSGSATPSYMSPVLTATNVYYYVLQVACASTSMTATSNEATVSVNGYPSASVAPTSTICAGQNLVLNSGTDFGNVFYWTGPSSFTSSVQNPTIVNAPASAQGNYTLIVSANGCSATPVVVTTTINNTSLGIQSNPGSLCLGNTATLTAVGNATTLMWSPGSSTSNSITVSPTSTSIYTVVGTGTSNCQQTTEYTLTVYNPTIATTNATICNSPGTSTLTATGFTTSVINWYASPTSTTSLASGGTFVPPLASSTTTYYAQAANSSTNSLFVSLAAGNGQQGNMFDIVAQQNIEVNAFDIHLSNTITNTVEIWYKPGTWVGFNTSNAGWTNVVTTTVVGLGNGVLTPVPLTFTVPISAGQTYGWYVTCNGGGNVNYTNGTAIGAMWASNSDLQVLQGNGGTYFGVTFSPRCFNGQVYYSKPGCTSPMTAAVLNVGAAINVTASASSGTVCAGGSTALNAGGASTYTWMPGGATGAIIAVTPGSTTIYSVTGDNGAGCVGTGTVEVFVNSLPSVSLTAAQTTVCTNGPTVALTGSPAGGAYTGSNVTTGVFTPGATAGTFMPSYNITSSVTGCSNSASVTIIVSTCTGIDNSVARINGLSVYPNPNLGEFVIELNNGFVKTYEVTDLTGRVIMNGSTAKDKMNVNINAFANGVYFVKVKSNDTVEIIKIVKQ